MRPVTLIQFEDHVAREYCGRTPGVSLRKYREAYPRGARLQEWVDSLCHAATSGEPISARVMDDLFRRNERVGWHVLRLVNLHTPPAPGSIYMPPSTRAKQRED